MTDILDFKTSPKEFRAWHKTWSSQPSDDGGSGINWMMRVRSIYQSNKWNRYVQWLEWSMWVPLEDVILLQRTGLYDKNNKKIREGDIVSLTSYPNEKNIGYVTYWPYIHKNEGWRNGVECLWFYIARNWEPIFCDNWRGNEIEVIGNVFENSALLPTNETNE
jgi:uncharacterized phage protein (TIGR01671 family)